MSTKRQLIESFRKGLQEVNADSTYTNQFLYQRLSEQAKWLIRREISAGRIYRNTSFFQTLGCQEVIEASTIDECCPVKTNCRIYRTKKKFVETWVDDYGPIIKDITSVDNSTSFSFITPSAWLNKKDNPYQKKIKTKYVFYSDGYFWFPEDNPHRVNIRAFFKDDITRESDCANTKDCIRFLDTRFIVPDWIEAEMIAKATQLLLPSKQMIEDEQQDKNPNRKN